MGGTGDIVGLIAEVLTWVGFGAGMAVLAVALIVRIIDGTWLPARGAVESTEHGPVVRWFGDEGEVNEAALSDDDVRTLGGRDMAELYYRSGWHNRMRLTPGSPAVRGLLQLALLMLGVGLVASVVQWIVLILEG